MNFDNIDKKYTLYLKSKLKRLNEIINGVSNQGASYPSTCLTIMKKLCADKHVCREYMNYIAHKVGQELKINGSNEVNKYAELALKALLEEDSLANENSFKDIYDQLNNYQNDYKNSHYGVVIREIKSSKLYILETILLCQIRKNIDYQYYAYDITKMYTEKYDPSIPYEINFKSTNALKDVLNFWQSFHDTYQQSQQKLT